MLLHIYGIIYTTLYVALCKMFIETFAKKRYINNKPELFTERYLN